MSAQSISGGSLETIRSAEPAGRPLVDAYVTEVSQDTWILFPRDAESQYVVPLAASRTESK